MLPSGSESYKCIMPTTSFSTSHKEDPFEVVKDLNKKKIDLNSLCGNNKIPDSRYL